MRDGDACHFCTLPRMRACFGEEVSVREIANNRQGGIYITHGCEFSITHIPHFVQQAHIAMPPSAATSASPYTLQTAYVIGETVLEAWSEIRIEVIKG